MPLHYIRYYASVIDIKSSDLEDYAELKSVLSKIIYVPYMEPSYHQRGFLIEYVNKGIL